MLRALLLPWLSALALASAKGSTTIWATPHDSYSSSVGVLGCKIDTNRVAYWPASVDCTNICVRLTHGARSLYLLRIDQSGGAYDVSYDAWNWLVTGESASKKPFAGGGIEMQYEDVPASKCEDLIHTKDNKLPLSAANSMNYLASCLESKDSWVRKNYILYNILDPICTLGKDESCSLDLAVSNQAKCPSTMGIPTPLKSAPVYNIRYPTGEKVLAGDTTVAAVAGSAASRQSAGWMLVVAIWHCAAALLQ